MLSETLTTLKPLYSGGDSRFFFNQTQTKRTIIKMGVIRMANLAQTNTSDMGGKRGQGIDYSAIARSEKFKKLMQAKKKVYRANVHFLHGFLLYFTHNDIL